MPGTVKHRRGRGDLGLQIQPRGVLIINSVKAIPQVTSEQRVLRGGARLGCMWDIELFQEQGTEKAKDEPQQQADGKEVQKLAKDSANRGHVHFRRLSQALQRHKTVATTLSIHGKQGL